MGKASKRKAENSFKIEKRGYSTAEVDAFIAEGNSAIAAQREIISELKKELDEKNTELSAFKQKQDLIVRSIMSAVQKAEQIEQLIKQKYSGELAHLTAFHEQWLGYYNKLIESYPLTAELSGLNQFNRRMSEILSGDGKPEQKFAEAGKQFESESQRLKKKYVGFIPVGEGSAQTGENLSEDLGGGLAGGEFNPEESIRQMLRRQAEEESKKNKLPPKNKDGSKTGAPAKKTTGETGQIGEKSKQNAAKTQISPQQDEGASTNGFSFEEALNPTQQLSDILKEIGLEFKD